MWYVEKRGNHGDYKVLSFPVVMIKHPDKGSLVEKGFILPHNSRLWSIEVGKSRQQQPEAPDHTMSHQKMQTMKKYLLLPHSFFPPRQPRSLHINEPNQERPPQAYSESRLQGDARFCQADN